MAGSVAILGEDVMRVVALMGHRPPAHLDAVLPIEEQRGLAVATRPLPHLRSELALRSSRRFFRPTRAIRFRGLRCQATTSATEGGRIVL